MTRINAPFVCPVCASEDHRKELSEALGWLDRLYFEFLKATDDMPPHKRIEYLEVLAKYSLSDTGKLTEAMSEPD